MSSTSSCTSPDLREEEHEDVDKKDYVNNEEYLEVWQERDASRAYDEKKVCEERKENMEIKREFVEINLS